MPNIIFKQHLGVEKWTAWLTFNLGLALIGLWATGPWSIPLRMIFFSFFLSSFIGDVECTGIFLITCRSSGFYCFASVGIVYDLLSEKPEQEQVSFSFQHWLWVVVFYLQQFQFFFFCFIFFFVFVRAEHYSQDDRLIPR